MTTYYVSTTGSDSNPGSLASPWATIQKAADTMVAGDTCYVRGGTYYQSCNLKKSGSVGSPITFRNYPGETVILDEQNTRRNGFTDRNEGTTRNYNVIDGFEIKNVLRGIEIYYSNNCIFRNSNIHHFSEFGIDIDGGEAATTVSGNTVSGNTIHDSTGAGYAGVFLGYHSNGSVSGCEIYNVAQNGICLTHESNYNDVYRNFVHDNDIGPNPAFEGIGIEVNSQHNRVFNNIIYNNIHAGYLTNSPNNEIYNNTIISGTGNDACISLGPWYSLPTSNIFKNNLCILRSSTDKLVSMWYVSDHGEPRYDGPSNVFTNNHYWNTLGGDNSNLFYVSTTSGGGACSFATWKSTYGKDTTGVLTNPNLVDYVGGDYHLTSTSPARDAGATVAAVPDDFDGVARPQGSAYDVGAYEYIATVLTLVASLTTASALSPTATFRSGAALVSPVATAAAQVGVAQFGQGTSIGGVAAQATATSPAAGFPNVATILAAAALALGASPAGLITSGGVGDALLVSQVGAATATSPIGVLAAGVRMFAVEAMASARSYDATLHPADALFNTELVVAFARSPEAILRIGLTGRLRGMLRSGSRGGRMRGGA